jgi:nicotinamide mononucleotide transporter
MSFDTAELIAFTLAIAMVMCNAKQIHWGWPLAILSSALYVWVFANAKLYGDAALQILFIALSLWGWLQWHRGAQASNSSPKLAPRAIPKLQALWGLALWLALCVLIAWILHRFTDSDAAIADAFITSSSIAATLLLARKFTVNWLIWLAVNMVSVILFISKQLWLSAVLYAVLAAMSVYGWQQWRHAEQILMTDD